MTRTILRIVMVATLALVAGTFKVAGAAEGDNFEKDLRTLTSAPNRLSGTPEGRKAAEYIEGRLREMGLTEIYQLEVPLVQTRVVKCQLQVGETTAELLPMRPNITVPPVTPEDGLTGPMVYLGRGGAEDLGDKQIDGAIAVLEYDCYDNWERVFAMGAKAVIFIGGPEVRSASAKHLGIPGNMVRLYAPEETVKKINLRKDYARATVVSEVTWERGVGRDVAAFVAGTDITRREPEVLVLATHYDTFGQVPDCSPGARGAANVAALLETAEHLSKQPLKRDTMIVFMDNEARYHQGAREFYQAVTMEDSLDAQMRGGHVEEKEYVERMLPLLDATDPGKWDAPAAIIGATVKALTDECDATRSDLGRKLMMMRMGEKAEGEEALREESRRWNDVRRILGEAAKPAEQAWKKEPELYRQLCLKVKTSQGKRLEELDTLIRIDGQRDALRRRLSGRRIILHLGYDLSDGGPKWGLVAGEYYPKMEIIAEPSMDNPGHYGRILATFRTAATSLKEDTGLAMETLRDSNVGRQFASGSFVAEGKAAGIHGIYNLAVMTGYDARERDGHPSDTVENLNWKKIQEEARGFRKVLEAADELDALAQPPVFSNRALNKRPTWHNDKLSASGDFAGLLVTGELLEQRPATGAVMAIWSGLSYRVMQPGYFQPETTAPFSFDPTVVEPVDASGNFELAGLDRGLFKSYCALAAVFGDRGEVRYITSHDTLPMTAAQSARVRTFAAEGYTLGPPMMGYGRPGIVRTRVMRARSDSELRDDQSLVGYDGRFTYFYIYRFYNLATERVKIFHGQGPALLDMSGTEPYGRGYALTELGASSDVDRMTARDLYSLNESRLGALRRRGVTDRSLESLNGRAGRLMESAAEVKATNGSAVKEEVELGRSTALSRRVHGPLRLLMNDLVNAIVILLLLAIPFAFVMERLIIGATGIYARLAGFAVIFVITFGLLYWMHPGFAVASTPIIIFLAFVIILLSSLVIFIVVRKFRTELKEMQGQSGRVHHIELSWLGTMVAAVSMGISTMRRRPIRTTLSAVTVVILTFTILCFASMTNQVGVRDIYEGPAGEEQSAGAFLRRLDCTEISPDILLLLRGLEGDGGLIAGEWWKAQNTQNDIPFSVANPRTGNAFYVDGVLGLMPEELERNTGLADALDGKDAGAKKAALKGRGVYLPSIVREQLKLEAGDDVLVSGIRMKLAGTFDNNRMQLMNHLDGRSVLPVDFRDPSNQVQQKVQPEIEVEADESLATRDFVRVNPNSMAIVSDEMVREMGGTLNAVNVYTAGRTDALKQGKQIAEVVDMPVWSKGPQGVERLIFTRLTEVTGGFALAVPVILGGLIIFGTMLGSVSDRRKEIYSFSALGLSPADVGFLFFAEAGVYAIVGGMVGQLLTQFVATGTGFLAAHRYIRPVSTNFSSSNSLFAMGVVMATVLVSAIYPAYRASRSANPGLQRRWKMPEPEGDVFTMTFPFTVSAYDITGVAGFLSEHFREHNDAGLGVFAAERVRLARSKEGHLELKARLALAPFDLGVTQDLTLSASPSEVPGVDEIIIRAERASGSASDWKRSNRTFLADLRRQFLLWRTLSAEAVETYRMRTLVELEEAGDAETEEAAGTEPAQG